MCYGTYQRYAKGREENFTGLPKSKYGPYSLKINNEYNGGWSGFNQETIQNLKDAGYGLQVFYNPEPRIYSYDHYFTAVSNGNNLHWNALQTPDLDSPNNLNTHRQNQNHPNHKYQHKLSIP